MSEALGIGLIGCGTVGGGVAQLLLGQRDRLARRAGRPLALRRVVVRNPAKPREPALPPDIVSADPGDAINDPNVHVVVELIGGTDVARRVVLDALAAGKHVVTANKALLAAHGPEVFDAARRHGRAVGFEGSVAGGIPIIATLAQSLAANQIISIQGILNGTSNFILTERADRGRSYAGALAEAQRLGYAEADPTLDVDGSDAAHKLAILAQIAFGAGPPAGAIERRGIADLDAMDLRFARELGYTIKLLAEGWLLEGQLALHVEPVLLRQTAPLAQVRGAFNAIQVVGDAVGETLYYGAGAGRMPTASSVVADVIDIAVGRSQRTFQTLRLWEAGTGNLELRPGDRVRSRFYLRLLVEDRPGVLADVCRVLADGDISIASVIQHEAIDDRENAIVPLVIMTHTALAGRFRAAAERMPRLGGVTTPSVYYPVAD